MNQFLNRQMQDKLVISHLSIIQCHIQTQLHKIYRLVDLLNKFSQIVFYRVLRIIFIAQDVSPGRFTKQI